MILRPPALLQTTKQLHKVPSRFYSQPTLTFSQWRRASQLKMATPSKIHLTPTTLGVVPNKAQNPETAAVTSKLLQENHDNHHIFFNQEGFHNHIVHHLLTLYGLGANTSQIERAYKENVSYQRPPVALEEKVVQDMSDPAHFKKYLGKEKYYHDFLVFFQSEMEKKGWEQTLQEYMFSGTEQADDVFGRMYAGFLHPIIHLGFGIEFNQPAIICEALAQACVHDTWISKYLNAVEEHLKSHPSPSSQPSLPSLLADIKNNPTLSKAAHWKDANKVRDGILVRAPNEMIAIASQFKSTPSGLTTRTQEMINAGIYFTTTAQNPKKEVKFDFFYIHCVNSSIFWPTFNKLSWLSIENKCKLLDYKVWLDLAMYASRGSSSLNLEEITSYTPLKPSKGEKPWEDIFERLFNLEGEDGHAVKLGRAVRNGELVCKGVGEEEWCVVKGDMWEKVGEMVVDSVEDRGGQTWVRSTGFEEAWEGIGERKGRAQL